MTDLHVRKLLRVCLGDLDRGCSSGRPAWVAVDRWPGNWAGHRRRRRYDCLGGLGVWARRVLQK